MIVDRRERVVKFFFDFAFGDKPWLFEGECDFRGTVETKVPQLGPDPAERGTEPRNYGSRDTTEGETLKLVAVGPSQAKGCRFEWRGCAGNGINVRSNLVRKRVQV